MFAFLLRNENSYPASRGVLGEEWGLEHTWFYMMVFTYRLCLTIFATIISPASPGPERQTNDSSQQFNVAAVKLLIDVAIICNSWLQL